MLSGLQLESIVYACQRHQQQLPDQSRAGFFIGDGAGVGKGRTIAGASCCSLDQPSVLPALAFATSALAVKQTSTGKARTVAGASCCSLNPPSVLPAIAFATSAPAVMETIRSTRLRVAACKVLLQSSRCRTCLRQQCCQLLFASYDMWDLHRPGVIYSCGTASGCLVSRPCPGVVHLPGCVHRAGAGELAGWPSQAHLAVHRLRPAHRCSAGPG